MKAAPLLAPLLATALALAAPLAAALNFSDLEEGLHYQVLDNPGKFDPAKKGVEVVEVFLYTCPHCAALHPMLEGLRERLPRRAHLQSMPAVFGEAQRRHAELFWGLNLLNADDATHVAVFNSIHRARRSMNSDSDISSLAETRGLDGEKLLRAMQSLRVRSAVSRSSRMVRRWQIKGVPSFIVDGRFLLTASRANRFRQSDLVEATALVAKAVDEGRL